MSWIERKAKLAWNRLSEKEQAAYDFDFQKFLADYTDAIIEDYMKEVR